MTPSKATSRASLHACVQTAALTWPQLSLQASVLLEGLAMHVHELESPDCPGSSTCAVSPD